MKKLAGLLSTDAYKLHVYVYERIISHMLRDFWGVTGGKGVETWGPSPTQWRKS